MNPLAMKATVLAADANALSSFTTTGSDPGLARTPAIAGPPLSSTAWTIAARWPIESPGNTSSPVRAWCEKRIASAVPRIAMPSAEPTWRERRLDARMPRRTARSGRPRG